MARFRYSMQSILDIKLKMETQAKQEFQAAKNALNQEELILAEYRRRKGDCEEAAQQLLTGKLNLRDIEDNKTTILQLEEKIELQLENVAKANRKVEKAREKLADVMKERKTHENLKEKAFENFLQEEKREENKVIDELTSYTYGQKRQVSEQWQKT